MEELHPYLPKGAGGPDAARLLDTLAVLSHAVNFTVGCYCEEESHCHRSLLRQLFAERGAAIACTPA